MLDSHICEYMYVQKRESGAKPERSGHCKQGVCARVSIVPVKHEKESVSDDLQVRKPAWHKRWISEEDLTSARLWLASFPDEGRPRVGGLQLCPTETAGSVSSGLSVGYTKGGHIDHDVFSGHMYTTYLLLFRIPQVRSKPFGAGFTACSFLM